MYIYAHSQGIFERNHALLANSFRMLFLSSPQPSKVSVRVATAVSTLMSIPGDLWGRGWVPGAEGTLGGGGGARDLVSGHT